MKQEPGRRQPGIPSLQGGEDVKVACRLPTDWRGSPRGLSLVAHVVQGKIRRTRQVDAGQVVHLSGTWIVALAFRAVERSDSTIIPRRVLAEVVPARQGAR